MMRRRLLIGFALAIAAVWNVGCDSGSPPPASDAAKSEPVLLKPNLKANPKIKGKVELPRVRG
jgi:hypothetical protein